MFSSLWKNASAPSALVAAAAVAAEAEPDPAPHAGAGAQPLFKRSAQTRLRQRLGRARHLQFARDSQVHRIVEKVHPSFAIDAVRKAFHSCGSNTRQIIAGDEVLDAGKFHHNVTELGLSVGIVSHVVAQANSLNRYLQGTDLDNSHTVRCTWGTNSYDDATMWVQRPTPPVGGFHSEFQRRLDKFDSRTHR